MQTEEIHYQFKNIFPIQQISKKMQSSFPMVNPYFIKFYYYVPSMMYAGISIPPLTAELLENLSSNQNLFPSLNDLNWFGPSNETKEFQYQTSLNFKPIPLKTTQHEIQLENSRQEPKTSMQKKLNQNKKNDKTEYLPNQKQEEKKSNSAYLNEYRNILPNTIHQILSYIQRKNKSKNMITKLIGKFSTERKAVKIQDESSNDCLNLELSVSRFYAYQNNLKNKLSNYVTLQTLRILCTNENIDYDSEVFSVPQQRIYNKICRIAILHYLKFEVICVLMSSKRMQKDKKWEHLKVNRKIESYICCGFRVESE